jgi:hypothetical protein
MIVHSLEKKSVAQTVIETAQRRDLSLAFNYASLALNNSFFLQTLVRFHADALPPLTLLTGLSRNLPLTEPHMKSTTTSSPKSQTTIPALATSSRPSRLQL